MLWIAGLAVAWVLCLPGTELPDVRAAEIGPAAEFAPASTEPVSGEKTQTAPALAVDSPRRSMNRIGGPAHAQAANLKVSENGRFLTRNSDAHFFWLADSAQLLFYRLTREDAALYLQHRANLGFTVIQTQIVSFLGIRATNVDGDAPFIDGDPLRPNEPFWQNVDWIIDKAAELGLVVALVPDRNLVVVDDASKKFGPLNVESAYQYGRYIGQRYRGKPIVWVLGWDTAPAGREAVFRAEADGIANGAADDDHGKVLITFHPHASSSSSNWFHSEDWVDFNSVQSGHMDDTNEHGFPETHSLIEADYAKFPPKPTLDNEPSYEDTQDGFWNSKKGKRMNADVIRRKAYWAVFAGAFGHTYGHNDIVAFHKPGQPSYSGQRNDWKSVLDSRGARQMVHLRRLLESRPPEHRIPDQNLLASSAGTGPGHVRAMRAVDGSYAFVYVPNGRGISLRMGSMAGQALQASWFDPRFGAVSVIGNFCRQGTTDFMLPQGLDGGSNDWVLILDSLSESNTPPSCRSY